MLEYLCGEASSEALINDPQLSPYLSSADRAQLRNRCSYRFGSHSVAQEAVRQLKAVGVPILAGTDAPFGSVHGVSLHHELELLVNAGLTPVEALAVATSIPARIFDLADRGRMVDTTVATRLVLGFMAPAAALASCLPQPWQLSSLPASYLSAVGVKGEKPPEQPNLLLVFNDLLLNQDGQGRVQGDSSACYVGFNIPAAHPETGEQGMMHVRIFTGNPRSVPGRYRDALPARVKHEQRIMAEGTTSTVIETFEVHPESGGSIELHLIYERGPLVHLVADRPTFPVWAAMDSRILRVYQEDMLLEVVRNDATGINRVQQETFRLTVPELADLFDGSERLVSIIANPRYTRKTFSSGLEYADAAFSAER